HLGCRRTKKAPTTLWGSRGGSKEDTNEYELRAEYRQPTPTTVERPSKERAPAEKGIEGGRVGAGPGWSSRRRLIRSAGGCSRASKASSCVASLLATTQERSVALSTAACGSSSSGSNGRVRSGRQAADV